jgi:glycosyltransferase involved in cell wall biosynthesis
MLKNIVIVCDSAGITGGTERIAVSSAVGLSQRGFNVLYFAGEGEVSAELAADARIHVHPLNLTDAYSSSKVEVLKRFAWYPAAADEFESAIKKIGFSPNETIVHVHSFRRVLTGAVVKSAKRLGFKLVFTLHDFGLVCPNTSFYNFSRQSICTLDPLSFACKTRQCTHSGWPMKIMQTRRAQAIKRHNVAQDFDAYICVSQFSHDILKPHLANHPCVKVIENIVDAIKAEAAKPEDSDTFTFVGRLSPEKGVRIFAEAAKLAGVPCQFVGSGPEADAIKMINPNARLTGWLSPSETDLAIRASRAVVMPSVWYETAGLAVLESLSRGIPAIVSDKCASVGYIRNHETGIVYNGTSSSALAHVLRGFDQTTAKNLGAEAYISYWNNPFSAQRHFDQLVPMYKELLMTD